MQSTVVAGGNSMYGTSDTNPLSFITNARCIEYDLCLLFGRDGVLNHADLSQLVILPQQHAIAVIPSMTFVEVAASVESFDVCNMSLIPRCLIHVTASASWSTYAGGITCEWVAYREGSRQLLSECS